MRTKLKDQLSANTDVEFIELKKSMEIADWVRAIKRKYKLSEEDLMAYLELKNNADVRAILYGYHVYDLLTIARIEAMVITLKANENQLDDKNVDD